MSEPAEVRVGPSVELKESCYGCRYESSECYAVQGDSGAIVYCTHPSGQRRRIGDSNWDTPSWCPARKADPRDARIAELETALRGLLAELPTCIVSGCGAPATQGHGDTEPVVCWAHRETDSHPRALRGCDWADAVEAAERAMGRRK